MIEGIQYVSTVRAYFDYLITEFGFKLLKESIRGNAFYDVQYNDNNRVVSISYENVEDYFQVVIFLVQNGELPDYDDKSRTLQLNQLNAKILSRASKSEIESNNAHFSNFSAKNELEKKLLKAAKEMRLCLTNSDRF